VAEWLQEILAGTGVAGSRWLDVDYQRYAGAEAALGWLNWRGYVELDRPLSPAELIGPWLEDLDGGLSRAGIEIVHLKAFDRAPTGYVKASLCGNAEEPTVEGELAASPAKRHELLLNLRAPAVPEQLRSIVEQAAGRLPGRVKQLHSESFRPAPPQPEQRVAPGA
jgi:hypothetical protein